MKTEDGKVIYLYYHLNIKEKDVLYIPLDQENNYEVMF